MQHLPPEAQRELATVDGCTYIAVEAVYRQERDGQRTYYGPLCRWEGSEARKLAEAYRRIAEIEDQLEQLQQARRNGHKKPAQNGHQPPVPCPLCGKEYAPGQSILVHLRRMHACNNLEEAIHRANEGTGAERGGGQAAEGEPEPEPG
jgi:hypothetical protein